MGYDFFYVSCIWNRINAVHFMQLVPLVPFVAVHLKNCFLLPSCHLTLMSFCTQGLPGVAESTFSKSEGKPSSPWGEGPLQGGRGERESVFVWPCPTVCDGPPSPLGGGVFFGWWILRLRLSAPRRMTRWGAFCEEWKFSDLTNQPKGSLVLCAWVEA